MRLRRAAPRLEQLSQAFLGLGIMGQKPEMFAIQPFGIIELPETEIQTGQILMETAGAGIEANRRFKPFRGFPVFVEFLKKMAEVPVGSGISGVQLDRRAVLLHRFIDTVELL